MKLYTKKGDDGSTGLVGGARVGKDDARVGAYGDVDEANAAIGLAAAACAHEPIVERLRRVQADLFTLGAELATKDGEEPKLTIGEDEVSRLERWIDEASDKVEPLKCFILPGGTDEAARLHVARTVCRRAERSVIGLMRTRPVRPPSVHYLNRLSDLLFAWARSANARAGRDDIPWTAPPA